MKQLLYFTLLLIAFTSCKNNPKLEQNNQETSTTLTYENSDIITMKGDFIFYDGAGVFQTNTEIYGVVVDDNLKKLDQQVQSFQKADTDIIPVTLKVRRFEKPNAVDTWKKWIEIKEIIKVHEPSYQNKEVITIGQ